MRSFLIKSNNYSPNNLGAYNYKFELNEEESTVTLVTNNGSYELGGGSNFEFSSDYGVDYRFGQISPEIRIGYNNNNSSSRIDITTSYISTVSNDSVIYIGPQEGLMKIQNTMIWFPILSPYNSEVYTPSDLSIVFPSANIEQNSRIYMTYSVNGVKANANGDIDLLGIVNEVLTGTNPTLSYMTSTYPTSPIGTIVYFLSIDTPKEYVKVSSTQWISKDIDIVS